MPQITRKPNQLSTLVHTYGNQFRPSGRLSRMDETLSRIKNGAVNDGNTDPILPVRVRTRAEDVGRTLESSGS